MKDRKHSPGEKIGEIIIEIFIIVFAVTLSIWLHGWSEDRHEQKEVKEFLRGLKSDLTDDVRNIEENRKVIAKIDSNFDFAYHLNKGQVPDSIRGYDFAINVSFSRESTGQEFFDILRHSTFDQDSQEPFSPASEALKLFNSYKPVIEHNNAIVNNPVVLLGDINGDHKDDCIISFVLTSKDGGNAIVGHESAIYLNTGTGMKVAGAFPEFDFCYSLDHIKDQIIYGNEYECRPPYSKVVRPRKFIFDQGRIKAL